MQQKEPLPIGDFPDSILENVFCFLPPKDLIQNCRLVCKRFRDIIDSNGFWKSKCEREKKALPNFRFKELPPRYYQAICIYNAYGRNLLKNGHGDSRDGRVAHWQVLSNGGDGWTIECPPAGADPLPLANQHCFATSYGTCTKQQVIDLVKNGMFPEVMDQFKPPIEVSEWYAARFDCGSIYQVTVDLLNEERIPLASYDSGMLETQQWVGREWKQVKYTFRGYPAGVRFVKFMHTGRDTQFWAGHYGSKMAGGAVRILVTTSGDEKNSSNEAAPSEIGNRVT